MHQPEYPSTAPLAQHPAVENYVAAQDTWLIAQAQAFAWQLLAEIAEGLRPGVSEGQMHRRAEEVLRSHAIVKRWHVPAIRFGDHTGQSIFIGTRPEPENILRETDIAFLDLGPVLEIDGIEVEGDIGKTFCFGDDPVLNELKRFSEQLFQDGLAFWRQEACTGQALYAHLLEKTGAAGLAWNLPEAGHLTGAFPHKGWRDGLNHYPHYPQAGLWILEIQIRHPELSYGAFFEDLLV